MFIDIYTKSIVVNIKVSSIAYDGVEVVYLNTASIFINNQKSICTDANPIVYKRLIIFTNVNFSCI